MLLALAGGQPAGWESWSPTRHLGAAAHMVAHRGCWAHSVQRGWGSWVIPPWDEKEKEPRTAVWNHPEGVTEKTEPKKVKRLCGLTVGGVWSSARSPPRQQIGLSNLPSGSPWPTLLSDLLLCFRELSSNCYIYSLLNNGCLYPNALTLFLRKEISFTLLKVTRWKQQRLHMRGAFQCRGL